METKIKVESKNINNLTEDNLKNPFEVIKLLGEPDVINFETFKSSKKFQNQGLNIPILVKLYSLSKDKVNQSFSVNILNLHRFGFYQDKLTQFGLVKYLPNNESFKNEKIFFIKPVLGNSQYKGKFGDDEIYIKLKNSFKSIFGNLTIKEIDQYFETLLQQKKYKEIVEILIRGLGLEINEVSNLLIKKFLSSSKDKLLKQKLEKFIKVVYVKKYLANNPELQKYINKKSGKVNTSKIKKEIEKELKEIEKETKRKRIESLF